MHSMTQAQVLSDVGASIYQPLHSTAAVKLQVKEDYSRTSCATLNVAPSQARYRGSMFRRKLEHEYAAIRIQVRVSYASIRDSK
jgi:hypothetical protein